MRAAGELVSPRVAKAVEREMDYYLWKYKDGKYRTGVCSKCKRRFSVDGMGLKHGAEAVCPRCGWLLRVKDIGRGRKTLYQEFYITEWRKSEAEDCTLVMVGSYCSMDSRGIEPELAVPEITPINICVYRYGKDAVCFKRRAWAYDHKTGRWGHGEWERRRKCTSSAGAAFGGRLYEVSPDGWFDEAIQGTRFETVWSLLPNRLHEGGRVAVMENIAKKPYLEYFAKMGQAALAWEGAAGTYPRGTVNPRGKTAQAILGLTGQQLSEVKRDGIQLSGRILAVAHLLRGAGVTWKVRDIVRASEALLYPTEIMPLICRFPLELREKAIKYAVKVIEHHAENGGGYAITRDLRDYWKQLGELNADLRDEQVSFPKDLQAAHIAATARIKVKADRKLDAKIRERARRLRPVYAFEFGGLMMRPFTKGGDVIREGTALRHCVGSYVTSYAQGRTILCALRRIDAPDIPFRTVEFSAHDGQMVQCRGYKNQSPAEEQHAIDEFFAAWRAEKIDKKKERKTA